MESFTSVDKEETIKKYKSMWEAEGFRVHISQRGYHSDAVFCVVKPGCIVSLRDIQNYKKEFPGWEVLYLPDQSWSKLSPFLRMKEKVDGRWWLKGEEHNDQLIEFVNTWLTDWVGYVEETVFDVNMLSIDENTIICNNYNKEVFDHFKKHRVEPIIFNFRHRYFWDGGIHCITQDLHREGTMEDYF
jgi:N-dimethylarginine dimethylaminohydrolase